MPSDTVMLAGVFIPIAAIVMGGLLLLVPIAGLTLRFALKPTLEALGQLRDTRAHAEGLRLVEQRLALLEEQVHALALAGPRSAPVAQLPAGEAARVPVGPLAPSRPAAHDGA